MEISSKIPRTLQLLGRLREQEENEAEKEDWHSETIAPARASKSSKLKEQTFALIVATAMTALRTVRQAHYDDPELSSRMPNAWRLLIKSIRQFDHDFGNIEGRD